MPKNHVSVRRAPTRSCLAHTDARKRKPRREASKLPSYYQLFWQLGAHRREFCYQSFALLTATQRYTSVCSSPRRAPSPVIPARANQPPRNLNTHTSFHTQYAGAISVHLRAHALSHSPFVYVNASQLTGSDNYFGFFTTQCIR